MKVIPLEEWQIQKAVFDWAKLNENAYPCLKYMIGTLSEGKRDPKRAGIAKSMGLKRGFPDIFLPVSHKYAKGLFIELKTPSGKVSEFQEGYMSFLIKMGYSVAVCHSSEEAIGMILDYLA